jgi:hypothetical protein
MNEITWETHITITKHDFKEYDDILRHAERIAKEGNADTVTFTFDDIEHSYNSHQCFERS